jgi:hypothetical protein
MKRFIILLISCFWGLNIYSQTINYYGTGIQGVENLYTIPKMGNDFLHTFDFRYQGIKGTPNLFDSFVTSYILVKGQEKYIKFESDIDLLRNSVIFKEPSDGKLIELSADNVTELVFTKYDKELIYRTTNEFHFNKKIRENKFCQVILEKPYHLIMITFKSFSKADHEPAFNSGRHFDEFKSERKFYLEDARGIFHQVILNKVDYNYIIHPTVINRKMLAKLFPDKKALIYREMEEKPDSVSVDRIYSILNKF